MVGNELSGFQFTSFNLQLPYKITSVAAILQIRKLKDLEVKLPDLKPKASRAKT